jgi:hypothetical protein
MSGPTGRSAKPPSATTGGAPVRASSAHYHPLLGRVVRVGPGAAPGTAEERRRRATEAERDTSRQKQRVARPFEVPDAPLSAQPLERRQQHNIDDLIRNYRTVVVSDEASGPPGPAAAAPARIQVDPQPTSSPRHLTARQHHDVAPALAPPAVATSRRPPTHSVPNATGNTHDEEQALRYRGMASTAAVKTKPDAYQQGIGGSAPPPSRVSQPHRPTQPMPPAETAAPDVVHTAVQLWKDLGVADESLSVAALQAALQPSDTASTRDSWQLLGDLMRTAINTLVFSASLDLAIDDIDGARQAERSPDQPGPASSLPVPSTPFTTLLSHTDGLVAHYFVRSLAASSSSVSFPASSGQGTTIDLKRFATTWWREYDETVTRRGGEDDSTGAGDSPDRGAGGSRAVHLAIKETDWRFLTHCTAQLGYARTADLAISTCSIPVYDPTATAAARTTARETAAAADQSSAPDAGLFTAIDEVLMLLLWLTDRYNLIEVATSIRQRDGRCAPFFRPQACFQEVYPNVSLSPCVTIGAANVGGKKDGTKQQSATDADRQAQLWSAQRAHHAQRLADQLRCARECHVAREERMGRGRDVTVAGAKEIECSMLLRETKLHLAAIKAHLATLAAQSSKLGTHAATDAIVAVSGGSDGGDSNTWSGVVHAWEALPALSGEIDLRRHAFRELGELVARRLLTTAAAPAPPLSAHLLDSSADAAEAKGAAASDDDDASASCGTLWTVDDETSLQARGRLAAAIESLRRRKVVRGLERGWQTHVRYGLTSDEVAEVRRNADRLKAQAPRWELRAMMESALTESAPRLQPCDPEVLRPLPLFAFEHVVFHPADSGAGVAEDAITAVQPTLLMETCYPYFASSRQWQEGAKGARDHTLEPRPYGLGLVGHVDDEAALAGLGAAFYAPSARCATVPQFTIVGEPGPGMSTSIDLLLEDREAATADDMVTGGEHQRSRRRSQSLQRAATAQALDALEADCTQRGLRVPRLASDRRAVLAALWASRGAVDTDAPRKQHAPPMGGSRRKLGSDASVSRASTPPALDPFRL